MANFISHVALAVALLCASVTSYSSSIVRSDGTSIGFKPADQSDLLMLNPPNEHGVSYNNFSQFVVSEKPLNISVAERLGDKVAQSDSTRLIIIHVRDVILQERITMLGKTADILLISDSVNATGYGKFSCINCGFENFGRVSLVAGSTRYGLGEHTNKIGAMSSLGGWHMDVSNLDAPGIAALDILSRSVNLSGTISTQYGLKKDARGGYVADAAGSVAASGGINIWGVGVKVDYETSYIIDVHPSTSGPLSIGAQLRSASVKASVSGTLSVNGSIDTRSSVLVAQQYRGNEYIPEEQIQLQAFGNSASIVVAAPLYSDNTINLNSQRDIYTNANVESKLINVVAGNKFKNEAQLTTDQFAAASFRFENNGSIDAEKELAVSAVAGLYNRYGGLLRSRTISLVSETSVVRNGSRKPYIHSESGTEILLDMETLEFNAVDLGIYSQFRSSGQITKAKSLAANIIGNSVSIAAKAFENINPYYVTRLATSDWSSGVPLDSHLSSQVSVTAEKQLDITTSEYVLNSSAVIGLNEPGGRAKIGTKWFLNERYRVLSTLNSVSLETSQTEGATQTNIRESGVSAELLASSPQGLYYAFGESEFVVQSAIVNNASFFETYNTATFNTPAIQLYGVVMADQIYEKEVNRVYTHNRCGYYGSTTDYTCSHSTKKIESEVYYTNAERLEMLFSINGNSYADNAAFEAVQYHDPLNALIDRAIEDFIGENTYYYRIDTWGGEPQKSQLISTSIDQARVSSIDEQRIIIQTQDFHSNYVTGNGFNELSYETFSIWKIVENFIAGLNNMIQSVTDWWNGETE